MSIAENVAEVRRRIHAAAIASGRAPEEILLVAATKMNDAGRVRQAVATGVDACGENRVQELLEKHPQGAYEGKPVHFIGQLQTNKVRQIVGLVDLIQSVDSEALLRKIDQQAEKRAIVQDVLLEVNIGGEEAKSGVAPEALDALLRSAGECSHLRVRGLMAIPPIAQGPRGNRDYFSAMRQLFVDIGAKKYDNVSMDFLSMGMSDDFEDAIACGANMVRVVSSIFGARNYTQNK